MNTIDIKAPAGRVRDFFLNPDIALRLNPSWHVKNIKPLDKSSYDLTLYDDRTEESLKIILSVELLDKSVNYRMNSDVIEFSVEEISPEFARLSVGGTFFRAEDIPFWLNGLQNYIMLQEKKGKAIKWFLDRLWLRMSPSQRRIALIIIIAEGIGLVALIAVVIALQIMK